MLQGISRLARGALRACLARFFVLLLAVLAVVLFFAARVWKVWDRWRTRRQLLRLIARRGVAR